MFNPKVVGSKEEVEKFECGKWSCHYDGQYTILYNEFGQKIMTFYVNLAHEMVTLFTQGFELGFTSGREFGKGEKAEEIKKILKI